MSAQPWKFILVQSEKQIEKLKNECFSSMEKYLREEANLEGEKLAAELEKSKNRYLDGYFTAPAYIVILTIRRVDTLPTILMMVHWLQDI